MRTTPLYISFSFAKLSAFASAFPKTPVCTNYRRGYHFSTLAAATRQTTTTSLASLPTAQGVASAHELLANKVVRTPLLESLLLNEQLNRRVLVKAECLQTTGSFKYRGALHRLLRLQQDDPEAAARGVVAFSSGNFGQALAAAASSLDINCCIVSPHDGTWTLAYIII
jgi:threonine synthase